MIYAIFHFLYRLNLKFSQTYTLGNEYKMIPDDGKPILMGRAELEGCRQIYKDHEDGYYSNSSM